LLASLFLPLLDGPEIAHRGFSVALIEAECRHVRVNGRQAALQPLPEILVIELGLAKGPKRRRVRMRTASGRGHGVAAAAKLLEHASDPLLLAVERAARLA